MSGAHATLSAELTREIHKLIAYYGYRSDILVLVSRTGPRVVGRALMLSDGQLSSDLRAEIISSRPGVPVLTFEGDRGRGGTIVHWLAPPFDSHLSN